ncbi:hypothetical protein HYV82_02680 [Candidatus Woesearchaeota archaeon]|nr:hypothetical protein [Candidatus Woesearchaeota archaeon]
MAEKAKKEDALIAKYRARLEEEFSGKKPKAREAGASGRDEKKQAYTANYISFKKELLPKHLSLYEKLCNTAEKILKISPDKKKAAELKEQLDLCHLATTPAGTYSLAILAFIISAVSISLLGYVLFKSMFFIIYAVMFGAVLMAALMKLPEFFSNSWRLKASNQMVQCIFYVATYMRHTSNLELAIKFAADHLSAPLSLDLRKVLWDVETERYGTIRESLDNYLQTWEKWNSEFIEAFHLIEGSLLEPSDDRRLGMVDKALSVMLEETYEKMLRYAHELKGPITMLYMLGIILPVLGLVILPLVASFMTSDVNPYTLAMYIALLYNITLPLIIYYAGKMVLAKRPTGYGETDISEENPELKKYKKVIIRLGKSETEINPALIAITIAALLLIIGLLPMLLGATTPKEALTQEPYFDESLQVKFLDYRMKKDSLTGPYGLGAAVISLLVPLGIGLGIGIYYKIKSSKIIKIRENTKKLEDEFSSALFQLGNRLGDGIPAEMAFGKVAEQTKGTTTGEFFTTVSMNIRRLGMGLQQAIFDPAKGALIYFPSTIIESTMKVLIESSRKGPRIASEAIINVSEYIKQIHRVNERLKDLMADIISDMKQQTHILAPAIAGIVVGITSMIVTILGRLSQNLASITTGAGTGSIGTQGLMNLFGEGIPTYYFQIIVGLYVVEIVYILTILTNGIENGADRLGEEYSIGNNMVSSTIIYCVISLIVIVMFNAIATVIMGTLNVGVPGVTG